MRWCAVSAPCSHQVKEECLISSFMQALALEFGERTETSHDGTPQDTQPDSTFYEITIATVDQPKLLSRLSDAMVSPCAIVNCLWPL